MAEQVLPESDWTRRADAHHARVDAFVEPYRGRARRAERHPVWDFLFTYYSLRFSQLRVWHPGYGVALAGAKATEYLDRTGYVESADGVTVGAEYLHSRIATVRFISGLLKATQDRAPRFNCFGLHEWAMVYRTEAPRHGIPLRLGAARTDRVVESMPLRCSHFDAYRFFTPAAAPRNSGAPARATQSDWEQPGCLHANMDLYKWCYKLGPLAPSELLMDCLLLAASARELDMRASPYDLTEFGFEPIAIEEPGGRAEYIRQQSVIALQAAPLRAALAGVCERSLMGSMETKAYVTCGYDGLTVVRED